MNNEQGPPTVFFSGSCSVENLCKKCNGCIIPKEWANVWGPGPYYGLGICGCELGMPELKCGDIIIDRNLDIARAKEASYGLRAQNIIAIVRPYYNVYGQEKFTTIWRDNGQRTTLSEK